LSVVCAEVLREDLSNNYQAKWKISVFLSTFVNKVMIKMYSGYLVIDVQVMFGIL